MYFNLDKLKESNNFLNIILDNINSAVFIVDENIRIQNFNESFLHLFNKTENDLLNELFGNASGCVYAVNEKTDCGKTSNCPKCKIRDSIITTLTKNVPVDKALLQRYFYINEKKIYKYFQYTTRYINFHNKKMILVIVDDITEIQNKNIELDKLNKLKNEFLGIVSHDLRNPISTVQMYANYLLESIKDNTISSNDELKEFLYPILESSEFMLQMLNDLLDISKIESGNFQLELTKFNYIELIKNTINKNQKIADNKNINIKFKIKNDIPEFKFDKHKIENVINNLISNAIKYSDPDSEIIVKISKSDSQVLTEIIDFGQGIPEKQQHNLFLPFKRAGSKTTGGEKSTGLGLSIVKKIVDAHNGEVGILSEKDKGSNFYFKLPII